MGTPLRPVGFIPDGFEPDEPTGFVPDGFEPDTSYETAQAPRDESGLELLWRWAFEPSTNKPSEYARSISEWVDPKRGTTGLRSLGSAYIESLGHVGDALTSPISLALAGLTGGGSLAARTALPQVSRAATITGRGLSLPVIAHGGEAMVNAETPAEFLMGGLEAAGGAVGARQSFPKVRPPRVRIPEILPPEPPIERLGLPPGRENVFIGGPPGGSGEVIRQGDILDDLRPQVEARLVADPTTGVSTGNPAARFFDLDELREAERQKDLFYTGHEQGGGTALELPDRPLMDIPVQAGDTRLGFESVSRADLPYPENIVPEALRPRAAQTMTRALTGDEFAREVLPNEPITFESARPTPEPPIGPKPFDLRGGTAAIRPGENILPSAPVKPKRASPHTQETSGMNNDFDNNLNANVAKNVEPAVPGSVESIAPILAQNKSTWRRIADGLFVSAEKQMERMGEVGTEVRRVLSATEYSKRELFNKFAEPFIKATKGLRPEEIENFVLTMDGQTEPVSVNVAIAVEQARKVTNMMAQMAEEAGVRVKTSSGKVVPFKGLDLYWPHRPVNPVARSSFIDELMRRNPRLSRSQAERLARQFQNESEWFNSPQHSRMFGTFEWRKDLNSMIDHIADMADIISRARVLGPGDIGQKGTLISRLIEKSPDPSKMHELVRTHLRGGLDKNDDFYQGLKTVNRFATKTQVFTKLGLFPISNLNNQLQTILHGNLTSFASSFAKTIAGSPTLKTLAREYGTVTVGEIPVGILTEAGKKQVPIVGNLVKWAEDFARTVATGTGQGTAKAVFKAAQTGDTVAVRKLQNLLLENDVTDILKQPKLTPDQLKFATQRFVELAQQLDSGMKLPPAWVNEPLLHIPLIFKRFGFQGTKSVKDAIMSNPARNIPLFLVASPLLGELTGDLKSVVYGVIRGAPAPDGMLEAIAFELAGRHRFAEKLTGIESEAGDIEWVVNRLTADMMQSWGLGLIADMMQGALGGKNAGYTTLFGPAIDQALSIVSGIGQVDYENLGREALRALPVVGPGLQRRLLPFESQEVP